MADGWLEGCVIGWFFPDHLDGDYFPWSLQLG